MEEAARVVAVATFGDLYIRSEAAAEGTKLHDIIADCLRCDRRPEPADYPAFDSEAVEALAFCYDYAQSILLRSDIENDLTLIEVRLDLTGLGIERGGTIDFALVRPGEWFYLIDWKFGGLPVTSPRYNRQMQAYAHGLCEQYGCQHGTAAICQPRAGTPVKVDDFTAAELQEHAGNIRVIVSRAKDPQAPLIPGDHCTLCNARDTCPARRALAEATIANRPAPTLATLRSMEPAKRLDFYERLKLAKSWVEGALGEVEGAILEGKLDVPGLMIGEGRKARAWVSEAQAVNVLTELMGEGLMYKRQIVSPAEAERLLGKNRVTAAKLRDVIVSIPGKPRVVRTGTTGAIGED